MRDSGGADVRDSGETDGVAEAYSTSSEGSLQPITVKTSISHPIEDGASEPLSSLPASGSSLQPSASGGPPTPSTQPQQQESLQELLSAGGWSPADVIVSVYYIGVDFEYRRSAKLVRLISYRLDSQTTLGP